MSKASKNTSVVDERVPRHWATKLEEPVGWSKLRLQQSSRAHFPIPVRTILAHLFSKLL